MSKVVDHDYHLHIVEMQSTGAAADMTLCSFITFCSGLMGKPIQSQMIILGDMSLGGTIEKASNLAESLQVGFDAGSKRILIPMSSVGDIPTIPGELFAKFQISFYSDPVDAVYKALGVEWNEDNQNNIKTADLSSRGVTLLSWSHYVELLSISDDAGRSFYEKQCLSKICSVRELKRQRNASLFERITLSRDKNKIAVLARKGQMIETSKDIIKDPYHTGGW